MRTSAKMGLRIWNLLSDPYDHEQLADNWAKVDAHDHSPGRGVLIPTEGLALESVNTEQLANGSVTVKKIPTIVGPEALVKRVSETEYEPSATRVTFVIALFSHPAKAGGVVNGNVVVGGVTLIGAFIPTTAESGVEASISFIVPPGIKWKPICGTETEVWSSYTFLF